MRTDTLPLEFSSIAHLVEYVVKRTHNEFSSSCPKCGGNIHKNGEYPDRFRLFLNAHGMNRVFGWCRSCGYTWFPDKTGKLSKEEIEQWRREQAKIEDERRRSAEKALSLLNNEKAWERFYESNNDWSREMFHGWGIAESWIEYLKLGLMPDYVVRHDEEFYHSPAATIPVWNVGGVVQNTHD